MSRNEACGQHRVGADNTLFRESRSFCVDTQVLQHQNAVPGLLVHLRKFAMPSRSFIPSCKLRVAATPRLHAQTLLEGEYGAVAARGGSRGPLP